MAGDNFDKGWVYILHFKIPSQKSNYFKIGLTKNPIPKRISGLQTGNPFKIVKQHHFDSECMGLLEGHLHKIFASRRFRKEWFTFTPGVLKKVIKEGTDFSNKYNPLAIKLRKLDKQTSIHKPVAPTAKHLKLHKKAITISRKIQEIDLQREIAKENLRRLTGNCIGIDGITGFTGLKIPAPSLKSSELKKHDLSEWQKWQITGIFSKKEEIIGVGTNLKNHPKLDTKHKIKSEGGKIYGIGAPSRASTLVNYTGLDDNMLDCVLELPGSQKLGKYLPGTLIPVESEARLFDDPPDYALLLSWHIAEELMPKLTEKGFKGGYIIPLPDARIVPGV